MSELNSGKIKITNDGNIIMQFSNYHHVIDSDTELYYKHQADQVIADLIEKNKRLAHKDAIMASETIKDLFKELRHHKYKRCLAMAKWCYAKWDDTATKYYKSVWYRKWEVKWLALAEKFKPSNTTAQQGKG